VLPVEGARVTVHESLRWTSQQKREWQRYESGQVVTFASASAATPRRSTDTLIEVSLAHCRRSSQPHHRYDKSYYCNPSVTPGMIATAV